MPVSTAVARVSLASASPPATRTGHTLVVRCRVVSGTDAYIRASLYEGATDRTGIIEVPISTTMTSYALPISNDEAASITSYSNLEVRFWGYKPTGTGVGFEVTEVSLKTPSPGAATTVFGSSALPLNFQAQTAGTVADTEVATGVARISLASASDPGVDTGHVIQVRARAFSGAGTIKVALYEGASNRSGDLETPVLGATFADYNLAIPAASAANITSYANLEIRLWGIGQAATGGTYGSSTYGSLGYGGGVTSGASFEVARVALLISQVSGSGTTVGLATDTSSAFAAVAQGGLRAFIRVRTCTRLSRCSRPLFP